MARCIGCSAPLKTNVLWCEYCGTRNDLDLTGKVKTNIDTSEALCPECNICMQTIAVSLGEAIHLDHCDKCYGLFFATGKLEQSLKLGTDNIAGIQHKLISQINQDRFIKCRQVRYRKCPICQAFMRRTGYGKRSGVIVDICAQHGIWLDNGELIQLLEWTKAGGQLLHQHHEATTMKTPTGGYNPTAKPQRGVDLNASLEDLIEGFVGRLIDRIF